MRLNDNVRFYLLLNVTLNNKQRGFLFVSHLISFHKLKFGNKMSYEIRLSYTLTIDKALSKIFPKINQVQIEYDPHYISKTKTLP